MLLGLEADSRRLRRALCSSAYMQEESCLDRQGLHTVNMGAPEVRIDEAGAELDRLTRTAGVTFYLSPATVVTSCGDLQSWNHRKLVSIY